MKKTILFFFIFLLSLGIALGYGEYNTGTYNEGNYGFGTPAPAEEPVTTTSSSGGSSASGGGGIAIPKKIDVKIDDRTTKLSLSHGKVYGISTKSGTEHTLKLDKLYSNRATITFSSKPQTVTLFVGDSKIFESVKVTLDSIIGGSAVFLIEDITTSVIENVALVIDKPEHTDDKPISIPVDIPPEPEQKQAPIAWIIAAVVVIIGIVGIVVYQRKKQ